MRDKFNNKNNVRVMILTCDLFSRIGGGEQVYRTLISENPTIDFFYLTTGADFKHSLPANVTPIRLKRRLRLRDMSTLGRYNKNLKQKTSIDLNPNEKIAAEKANQYASSISGLVFDLIDVPEYEIVGDYLHAALLKHKVTFQKVSTFLHGSLSRTIDFENGFSKAAIRELMDLEERQRNAADFFMSLGDWYLSVLGVEESKCLIFNPWIFVAHDDPSTKIMSNKAPKLIHFSRSERRKGADLLPGLVKLLCKRDFDVLLLGEQARESFYLSSIKSSAINREVNLQCLDISERVVAFECIGTNDVLMIPSRFDSFNLVALEALASGKNIALSNQTGAYHYLKKYHSEIFLIEFNPFNLSESAQLLNRGYEEIQSSKFLARHNKLLCSEVFSNLVRNQMTLDLPSQLMKHDLLKAHFPDIFVFSKFSPPEFLVKIYKGGKRVLRNMHNFKRMRISPLRFQNWAACRSFLLISYTYFKTASPVKFLIPKIALNHWFERPQLYLELAESKSLVLLTRLTYALRALRFSGYSNEAIDVKSVESDLISLGLLEEAKAIQAICADDNGEMVLQYLENRRANLKVTPEFTFTWRQQLDSNNLSKEPKVTIIVSSYNASAKMGVFLEKLSLCSELLDGHAEILLIDANSNTPDYLTALRIANLLGMSLRSIRVNRRISIQEAWNFGIVNSTAPYLTFLGLDETIYPNAIRDLSSALDMQSSIDWVMGNSIVTEVDDEGNHVRDIHKYDRSGAELGSPFLETCYVSYVGGMYRRNIHERFGYYDPSFRGAGDTEFKSRVLPSLKVCYLNSTLGEFMNYPEERTTATELIEIEDVRAWYIFRTPGGLMYQAGLAEENFLESISRCSLGYRKSYCAHESTDLELASASLQVIQRKKINVNRETILDLENANQILKSMRVTLGYSSSNSKNLGPIRFFNLLKWFDRSERRSLLKGSLRMRFDNMFEQHSWFW